MKIQYCPFCGTKLEDTTSPCSACGGDLSRFISSPDPSDFAGQMETVMRDFIENNEDLLKELTEQMERGAPVEKGMFFSVEMRGEKPIMKSGNIEDMEKVLKGVPLPPFVRNMIQKTIPSENSEKGLEFKETEHQILTVPRGKDILVQMPGVASKDSVEIKRKNDRLEVMGKGQGTIYFTEVDMEEDLVVVAFNILNGLLRIETRKMS